MTDSDDEAALITAYLEAESGADALAALEMLGRRNVGLSHIWDATEHPVARFRSTALDALASFHGDVDESEPFILRGLRDQNPYVVQAATRAAAKHGVDAARPTLLELCEDPQSHTRAAALLALGHLGVPEDLDLLLAALDDNGAKTGAKICRAIGTLAARHPTIAGPRLVDELPALFGRFDGQDNPTAWQSLRGLLRGLRDLPLPDATVEVLLAQFGHAGIRGELAKLLAGHGVEAIRHLIEEPLLAEPSVRLRCDYLAALGELGAEPSLDILDELSTRPLDGRVAIELVRAVARCTDPRAERIVVRLASGPDLHVRATALTILSHGRHPLAVPLAQAGLTDSASPVRLAATGTLATFPGHHDLLCHAAGDEQDEVVRAAMMEAAERSGRGGAEIDDDEDPALVHLLAAIPSGDDPGSVAVRAVLLDCFDRGETDRGCLTAALDAAAVSARSAAASIGRLPAR